MWRAGEKFYIINNRYLWLHIKLTPEATDDRAMSSCWVASPQPLRRVDRSGSQSRETLHKESILSKHASMSKRPLILFVKAVNSLPHPELPTPGKQKCEINALFPEYIKHNWNNCCSALLCFVILIITVMGKNMSFSQSKSSTGCFCNDHTWMWRNAAAWQAISSGGWERAGHHSSQSYGKNSGFIRLQAIFIDKEHFLLTFR